MRRIHYGTGVVLTTDDVADALLRLNVALANLSHTERVTIPVASGESADGSVDLILGPGIAVMSEPAPWHGDEPDFSTGATLLRMHPHYPYRRAPPDRRSRCRRSRPTTGTPISTATDTGGRRSSSRWRDLRPGRMVRAQLASTTHEPRRG